MSGPPNTAKVSRILIGEGLNPPIANRTAMRAVSATAPKKEVKFMRERVVSEPTLT
jgi:hypothetical protein